MLENLSKLSIRVKTAFVLLILFLVVVYIDSYFLFWLVFGIMLMISVHESKELYKLNSDSIYIYTLLLWVAVYFYPMPIDLIFIVRAICSS